jgi:replication factor A1
MSDILDIYEKLGGRVTQKEFNKLIDEKMEVMGGLCDERTAALLVAHDLGVEDASAIKIKDISLDRKNVEFIGKVISTNEPREFNRNDGSIGKVCSISVADETGDVRVVLWDELADAVRTGDIKDEDIFKIKGYVKESQQGIEVHIGRGGGIQRAQNEKIIVKDPMIKISDIKPGMGNICIRGVILSKQEPRTFNRKDGSSGVVASMIIGDDTGKIRATLWDNKVKDMDALNIGDSVEILHGYARESFGGNIEVQAGNRGIVRKSIIEVTFDEKLTKIGDVVPDRSYNIKGIVTGIDGVREFVSKDGKPGRLCGVHISDDTGRIRIVFWGEHANFAEALSVGDEILVTDVQSKTGLRDMELSANWRSSVRRLK